MTRHFNFLVDDDTRNFFQKVACDGVEVPEIAPDRMEKTASIQKTAVEQLDERINTDLAIINMAGPVGRTFGMCKRSMNYLDKIASDPILLANPEYSRAVFEKVAASAIDLDITEGTRQLCEGAPEECHAEIRSKMAQLGLDLVKEASLLSLPGRAIGAIGRGFAAAKGGISGWRSAGKIRRAAENVGRLEGLAAKHEGVMKNLQSAGSGGAKIGKQEQLLAKTQAQHGAAQLHHENVYGKASPQIQEAARLKGRSPKTPPAAGGAPAVAASSPTTGAGAAAAATQPAKTSYFAHAKSLTPANYAATKSWMKQNIKDASGKPIQKWNDSHWEQGLKATGNHPSAAAKPAAGATAPATPAATPAAPTGAPAATPAGTQAAPPPTTPPATPTKDPHSKGHLSPEEAKKVADLEAEQKLSPAEAMAKLKLTPEHVEGRIGNAWNDLTTKGWSALKPHQKSKLIATGALGVGGYRVATGRDIISGSKND